MLDILSNFEFVHFIVNSGIWINILYGILAVVCYGFFSKFYEPLTRSTESPLLTASLLYGGAAFLLFITAGIVALFLGVHFEPPPNVKVFGLNFNSMYVSIFGLNFSITWVILVLTLLILAMSLLYFAHIFTEAFARRGINMGVYTILFQVNVLVIAFIDWSIYRTSLSLFVVLGGIFILLSSTLSLFIHHFVLKKDEQATAKFNKKVIILGIFSAITCGLALYIDGEIGRNYIFHQGPFNPNFLVAFLLYEMLTFGIPFFWTFMLLSISKAPSRISHANGSSFQWFSFIRCSMKVPRNVLHQLKEEFKRSPKDYFLASLFSAGQFVFSVLALSLPGPRFYPAAALAISPLFSTFLDKNTRLKRIKALEYGCGAISAIGLFLLLIAGR